MATPPTAKYAHLSEMNVEYEPFQKQVEILAANLLNLPMVKARARSKEAGLLPDDLPKDLTITHLPVPVRDGKKLQIRIYKSNTLQKRWPLVFVCHGGGWFMGGHGTEEPLNQYIASRNRCTVVSVAYRLAPENKFPGPVNDCFDVLKWCLDNPERVSADPNKIFLAGSSCGSHLAIMLSHKIRDEGIPGLVVGQIMNLPVTCHPSHYPYDKYELLSWEQNKDDGVLKADRMQASWDYLIPEGDKEMEIAASPLIAESLKGLPPALVQVAGLDVLRDEGIAYHEALLEAGVSSTLKIFPGLPHGFEANPFLPSAAVYAQNVNDFIKEILHR